MSPQDLIQFELLPGHLIRRLQQMAVAVVTSELAAAQIDLTPVQFATLSALRDHPQIDQVGLGQLVALDRTTMSGVVERLAKKDLILRETSSLDRRARVLQLSPAGEALLAQAAPIVARAQDSIFAALPEEERSTFLRILRKVVEGADAPQKR